MSSELDVIQHLLNIENASALKLNEAYAEADKILNEAKTEVESKFSEIYKTKISLEEEKFLKRKNDALENHKKVLESYEKKLESFEKNYDEFSKVLSDKLTANGK